MRFDDHLNLYLVSLCLATSCGGGGGGDGVGSGSAGSGSAGSGSAGSGGAAVCGDGVPEAGQVCLGATQELPVGKGVGDDILIRDLDGDGVVDVLVATSAVSSQKDSTLRFHRGSGAGALAQAVITDMEDQSGAAIIELEAEGAGSRDLAIAGLSFVQVMESQGDGTYVAGAKFQVDGLGLIEAAGGDLDGDGRVDVVGVSPTMMGEGASILWGEGQGMFTQGEPVTLGDAQDLQIGGIARITVADVTGDGVDDLLKGSAVTGTLHVGVGDGERGFAVQAGLEVGFAFTEVTVARVDGDPVADVVLVDGDGSAYRVLLGRGDGTFDMGPGASLGEFTSKWQVARERVRVADFDGDERPDLVVGGVSGGLVVVPAFGEPGTYAPALVDWSDFVYFLETGDINGDGWVDVAAFTGEPELDTLTVAYNTP